MPSVVKSSVLSLEFSPERDAEFFAAIPPAPSVFLLRSDDPQAEPYVSKTTNLKRRLTRLLSAPEEHARRLNLRDRVRFVEYTLTGSDFESGLLLYRTLRRVFPESYRDRLRLRFAPLVKFNLDNPWPRAYVTQRIRGLRGSSVYYGPFPTRATAEKFLNDSLDLFKIRRCDFEIHPDPSYPGCIYSEMKMCLAPCFAGCTEEQYQHEVSRVRAFLDSAGQSLSRELSQQREQASANLEFEQAAALHARIEKIAAATHLPEIVRRLDLLAGVVVQPAAEAGSVALFPFQRGVLAGPVLFPIQQTEGKPQSMESRLQQMLAGVEPLARPSAVEIMESLAILKRWYYRSVKLGEIFLTDERGELPLRRLVRGVSRVFRGEKAEADPMTTAAREYWLARTRESGS
ncbi:MAG TPA: UvrB/UvrC motif-containing protein [Terriglobales bacterium]|nr:UvrB/UvrC motif-containing protein [Terriglobales bacterium]